MTTTALVDMTPAAAPSWDVFVAYSSPDRSAAQQIVEALNPYLRVFVDYEQIRPGDEWDDVLRRAIASAHIVLALVSRRSERAFFEREEILRALDLSRATATTTVLIPLFLEGLSPNAPEVPYGLRPLQGIVVASTSNFEAVAHQVIQRLSELRPLQFEGLRFAPSIRQRLHQISHEVEALTDEQYRVIQQLRHVKRVRISGSAGSGKTLVAAEKCSRLASSGLRVLFLCHNPLLAEFVKTLIPGTGVEVQDFCRWVNADLIAVESGVHVDWSHYAEPTQDQLNEFLITLAHRPLAYDAIIVDEAQDFREQWWAAVEAALLDPANSILYIFHDNNQSLLPRHSAYPIKELQFELSRNCRNAGRIHSLMRNFDATAPEPEPRLRALGFVSLTTMRAGQEASTLASLVRQHYQHASEASIAVLWMGAEDIHACPVANLRIPIASASPWQDEVRWQFGHATSHLSMTGLSMPTGGHGWVRQQLAALSHELFPTVEDIRIVRETATAFHITDSVRNSITNSGPYKYGFRWLVDHNRRLFLKRRAGGVVWGSEVILHFQGNDWHEGIPQPAYVDVLPFTSPKTKHSIPLYSVADLKGLEVDIVLLLMRGRVVSHRSAVYVGISRARAVLGIAADTVAASEFPRSFEWDGGESAA